MQKGRTFDVSKRILRRNGYRLVLGCYTFQKGSNYENCKYTRVQEKEYDVPEPPEEDEDIEENEAPQWIQTGPEYSSDYAGDGPDSSEEYDPEKEKASKRKRESAKVMRRLRRKHKQTDSLHRSTEYIKRSRKRRTGDEPRTAEIQTS